MKLTLTLVATDFITITTHIIGFISMNTVVYTHVALMTVVETTWRSTLDSMVKDLEVRTVRKVS